MRTKNRIIAVLFGAFSAVYGVGILWIDEISFGGDLLGPRWVPTFLFMTGLLLSVGLWFEKGLEAKNQRESQRRRQGPAELLGGLKSWFSSKMSWLIGAMAAFAFVLPYAGFVAATSFLMAVVIKLAGEKRWSVCIGVGVSLAAIVNLTFTYGLNVRFPMGAWWRFLN